MELEASVGKDTECEGGDYIYLASVFLCEVQKELDSAVYLYRRACEPMLCLPTWTQAGVNQECGAADNFETTARDVCMRVASIYAACDTVNIWEFAPEKTRGIFAVSRCFGFKTIIESRLKCQDPTAPTAPGDYFKIKQKQHEISNMPVLPFVLPCLLIMKLLSLRNALFSFSC